MRHLAADRMSLLFFLLPLALGCEPPASAAKATPANSQPSQVSPAAATPTSQPVTAMATKTQKVTKTDEEWRRLLTPEQYFILRQKGTEMPFTGQYDKTSDKGVYVCAACGQELFSSDTKFDSHCGWPSYFQPVGKDKVDESTDASHGMTRTEVTCSRCGGHLGHVFNDGPPPTGLRYCINSAALKLVKKEAATKPAGK
jgi:peptide-methionine (R)-S-oxide reductase